MLYKWRILGRFSQHNDRILDELDELTEMDADHFHEGLRAFRKTWDEHDHWQTAMLYEPATRRTRKGPEVCQTLQAEHESFRELLGNLEQSLDDFEQKLDHPEVTLEARRQLHAMRIDLARHMRRDERRALRPLMRRFSTEERKHLVRNLGPVES